MTPDQCPICGRPLDVAIENGWQVRTCNPCSLRMAHSIDAPATTPAPSASPATEDEARDRLLVDDLAYQAGRYGRDPGTPGVIAARTALLDHLSALRRRAEEAEAGWKAATADADALHDAVVEAEMESASLRAEVDGWRSAAQTVVLLLDPAGPGVSPASLVATAHGAKAATASLRAEVAALRQERDDARFDGANARAEVERLTAQAERDNATVRKLNAQRNALQTEAANSMAEVERLRERAHKADGMANEINILVGENRKLAAEVARAREEAFEEAARAVENFGDAAACDLAAELRALASPSPEKED